MTSSWSTFKSPARCAGSTYQMAPGRKCCSLHHSVCPLPCQLLFTTLLLLRSAHAIGKVCANFVVQRYISDCSLLCDFATAEAVSFHNSISKQAKDSWQLLDTACQMPRALRTTACPTPGRALTTQRSMPKSRCHAMRSWACYLCCQSLPQM